ncbi:cytochrome b5 [Dothidotthia symphoricarpi CBS 119687]|uniref:Cytochrome b5 n=1 Tax=Dothidotthia symphoricarpi CBS 119687 TaxID=1392245 RepID=A0A6A6ADT7_9PLEO|nr:cytochrome b5 [Dothidotthia symphoricarpi CBS 119687]KAF2129726.1 cytochrome b5 [Dothidotthia symphoricarpi CBS 119687]
MPNPAMITTTQLAQHNDPQDLWIAVHGKVYNLNPFANTHPGGVEVLHEHAGSDGSEAYDYAGHSYNALLALRRFEVGTLEGYAGESLVNAVLPVIELGGGVDAVESQPARRQQRGLVALLCLVMVGGLAVQWCRGFDSEARPSVQAESHTAVSSSSTSSLFSTGALAVTVVLAFLAGLAALLCGRIISAFSTHEKEVWDYPAIIRVRRDRRDE